jgi:LysM repeat protein
MIALLAASLAVGVFCVAPRTVSAARVSLDDEEKKTERKWIKHTVVPGERLKDIAARYGVTVAELKRWNKKRLPKSGWIFANRKISVYARLFPPPREKILYFVKRGDTWAKIADTHNVREKQLRRWNRKVPRRFKAGHKLVIYTNPVELPQPPQPGEPEPLPVFRVRAGGLAVGKPNRGRLLNGVELPDSDLYTKRKPDQSWGTSHAILEIQRAIATFRRDSGYDGRLEIGALSRKRGGRFRPHNSHQTGRDVDIRLPVLPGVPKGKNPKMDEIDWRAAWGLVKAFIDTGEVEYVFLEYNRQRRMHKAAVAAGADDEELRRILQYPRGRHTNNGIVRHSKGHVVHIHVRIRCASQNSRCETY